MKATTFSEPLALAGSITVALGKMPSLEKIRSQLAHGLQPSGFDRRFCNHGCDLAFYLAVPSFLMTLWQYKGQSKLSEKAMLKVSYGANAIVFLLNDGLGFANQNITGKLDISDLMMCLTGTTIAFLGYRLMLGVQNLNISNF